MQQPRFKVQERVTDVWRRVTGTVVALRDDTYERQQRASDPQHGFYYHIEYDDGKFDTYVSETSLSPVE